MGHSVGLRDGSERIRDTPRAPKGAKRGGASRWLSKGLSERSSRGSSKRVAKESSKEGAKGSSGGFPRGVLRAGYEGVFRRISERGASGWLRRGLPEGLPRRAATTV